MELSGPAGAARPSVAGDGPVSPTSTAISRLHPLGLGDVVLAEESQLGGWQRRNRARTLPYCIEQVAVSGALRNLQHVAEHPGHAAPHEGMHFSDSDVYKVLEAASWDRARGRTAGTEQYIDEATALLAGAQRADGYLNSFFQAQHPELIWEDLRWGHELYCAGHLLQATVASQRTGGPPELLAVTNRLLDHLFTTFSMEDGDGRLVGVCGHPVVETGLTEFYRLTGDERALQMAKRQVDLRGRPDVAMPTSGLVGDRRFPPSYFLHHAPVRTRKTATGHAVRELYLQAGVVDVAVETGDRELLDASEAIWDDLFQAKTYITGAHGSRHRDESIGDPYELPSDRAYGETCASIASFHWNWRLLLATGRARYAEAMEQVFWNTIAGAVSREGTEFFYSNTLHLRTGHDGGDEDSPRHRLRWYQCACCPPNLARLLASIQTYLVTRDAAGLQVHMPFGGTVSGPVPGGTADLSLLTGHPWAGTTEIEVTRCSSAGPWELSVRLPGWAGAAGARVALNGEPVDFQPQGSYIRVNRRWGPGDRLQVSTEVPVRLLRPHWRADAIRDSVAVQRGPLVYCVEEEDLEPGTVLEDVMLDDAAALEAGPDVPQGLEGHVKVAVHATGQRALGSERGLYEDAGTGAPSTRPVPLTLVPYFARSNRPAAAMRVWVPAAPRHGGHGPTT